MSKDLVPKHRVCFQVADVPPATERLPGLDLKSALDLHTNSRLLVCPDEAKEVVRAADFHPLIAAAAIAFQQHYPLVLSPDMIWLTVLQGVSQHIQNNSQQLRTRLVAHEAKLELNVHTELLDLPQTGLEMLAFVRKFSELIASHINPDKRALFQAEFSTTTEVERIVGNVVLMEAFQPYFDYVFAIVCGIPSIQLEGTVADWELLLRKIQALHQSDLELGWWTQNLLPLGEHFIQAAHGNPDLKHWRDLCKVMERYTVNDMNGWLLKFIPYIRKDPNELPIHRNPVLALTCYDEPKNPAPGSRLIVKGCTSDMLPTGISRVPATCINQLTGAKTELQFLAGFTGVEQSKDDLSLRPLIGWAISEGSQIDLLVNRLRKDFGCTAPANLDTQALLEIFENNIPGDMWKFYSEISETSFTLRQPNPWNASHCMLSRAKDVQPICDLKSVLDELNYLDKQAYLAEKVTQERKEFVWGYSGLRQFAFMSVPRYQPGIYVFGHTPKSDRGVYCWNHRLEPDGFTKVANSFTDWLAEVMDYAQPKRNNE